MLAIVLGSCQNRHVDENLIKIDKLISANADKALSELENDILIDGLDEYNQAYYYVLLAEVRDKKDQKLLPLDSLINCALKVLLNAGDDRLFTRALISKGKIWGELEAPQEALKCYHEALDLSQDNDFDILTSIYACIGNIYVDQALVDDAFVAFKTGYDKSISDNNLDNRYTNARNLGMVFFFKEQPDSAYKYLTQALNYVDFLADSVKLRDMIYNDLALCYNENDKHELALSYMDRISILTDTYALNKGAVYTSLEKYDSAAVYLKSVLKSTDLGTRAVALKEISELEEKRGNLSEALLYLNTFVEVYDSLTINTFSAEIHGLNQIHNIQTEISKVKNKHATRVMVLVSCSIICILLVVVIAIIIDKKKKMRQNQERLSHEMKIIEKEKEISSLQKLIAETRNRILELRYEKKNAVGEIREKEESIMNMQKQLDNLRIHLFNDKPIYKKIQKLDNQKESDNIMILASKDREELYKILQMIYADFYEELHNLCHLLTEEDLFFCCLAKMNFSMPLISACAGYPRTASARQRKHRIKKKMVEESDNIDLYNSIFQS